MVKTLLHLMQVCVQIWLLFSGLFSDSSILNLFLSMTKSTTSQITRNSYKSISNFRRENQKIVTFDEYFSFMPSNPKCSRKCKS